MDRFDKGTGTHWCRTAGLQGGQESPLYKAFRPGGGVVQGGQ